MVQSTDTIAILDEYVAELIKRHAVLSEHCKILEAELRDKENVITRLQEDMSQLQKKYQSLKTAQVVVTRDGDIEATRARFDKLVREIDKCISLLND